MRRWWRPLVCAALGVALGSGCAGPHRPDDVGTAGVRALVAIVGDSNVSQDGKWVVWDLTRGQGGLLSADHLDDNYVPLFVGRPGAGLRSPDCAARDLSCPSDDFWARKLHATFA